MVRCDNCRGGYLDPRPTADSLPRAYEHYYTHASRDNGDNVKRSAVQRLRRLLANDYRASRYGASVDGRILGGRLVLAALPKQRAVLDSFYRYLPRRAGKLIDFGCGNGDFLKVAQGELNWQVLGVDFDPAAVDAAKAIGLEAIQGDAETLLSMPASCDAITMSHVVEHVPSPKKLLEACMIALRPGGMVFVETPNMDALCHDRFGAFWRGLEVPRHLAIPSYDSLESLLGDCGFVRSKRHYRQGVLEAMFKRSSALADGMSSEDPACLARPGPDRELVAALANDPDKSEYVTMTAFKP